MRKEIQQRSQGLQLEDLNKGAGPQYPTLMNIGEAPGRDEVNTHISFHGRSGQESRVVNNFKFNQSGRVYY